MSENTSEAAILNEHRKLMFITGKFSDFQIKNLEMFPQIVFDNIKKIEIKYDIQTNKGAGFVEYKVKLFEKQDSLEKRKEDLTKWVKHLLFKEIEVKVHVSTTRSKKRV